MKLFLALATLLAAAGAFSPATTAPRVSSTVRSSSVAMAGWNDPYDSSRQDGTKGGAKLNLIPSGKNTKGLSKFEQEMADVDAKNNQLLLVGSAATLAICFLGFAFIN